MTLTLARPAVAGDPASPWVVCLGELRDVSQGMVLCPLGGRVTLDRCLACHHLADISDERDRAAPCAMGVELG